MEFLPTTYHEMLDAGWDKPDFVFINGDAYVDHPSFGAAIISRVLQNAGYKVAFICQPDWKNHKSVMTFGEPRLGFLVSSGNMDSMVNHYTVSKKKREFDAYSPNGATNLRPDRAAIVYSNLIRQAYKGATIILGGIEASLRRFAHYDYWDNCLKRSLLLDSGADIIAYGMSEKSIVEIADALNLGFKAQEITFVKGTVFKAKNLENIPNLITLPPYESLLADKKKYADSFLIQSRNNDFFNGNPLAEQYKDFFVVQNPPQPPLTQQEMDSVYDLPYMRDFHPSYKDLGGIPAIEEVKFSITSARGCFGACNFCALSFHQGRIIQSRSHESILKEAQLIAQLPDFKGYIHDVGGPTANFRNPSCQKQLTNGACKNNHCLFPSPCKNLTVDHADYIELLEKLRKIKGVKKVFVRSGLRFDYIMADKDDKFLTTLCQHHISGQLKVAPEHVSDNVLRHMGKPPSSVYKKFVAAYEKTNQRLGKKQYLVPYLMSSHPGSTLSDAICLAEYLRDSNLTPQQVQDFYPTPSTVSTCMYFTHINPLTQKSVYVADNPHEKAMQRALIQYKSPKNYHLVKEALTKGGRLDLIGNKGNCLIKPTSNPASFKSKPTANSTKSTAKSTAKSANNSKLNRKK